MFMVKLWDSCDREIVFDMHKTMKLTEQKEMELKEWKNTLQKKTDSSNLWQGLSLVVDYLKKKFS